MPNFKGCDEALVQMYNISWCHEKGFYLLLYSNQLTLPQATKGNQQKVFYTMPEYENWKELLNNNLRGWSIKYYKGLGTSTSKEAKEYFSALVTHRKTFVWKGQCLACSLAVLVFCLKELTHC